MPNWVEGKLKVRGKPEDIKRWVEECLHCYTTNWLGDGAHTELVKGAVRFEHDPDSEEMYLYVDKSAHIEGTRTAQQGALQGKAGVGFGVRWWRSAVPLERALVILRGSFPHG